MGNEFTDSTPPGRLEITEADLAEAPAVPAASTAPPSATAVSLDGHAARTRTGADWTEATRLMCAAAYLDGTFAQDAVDEILREDHRAVQIPAGVDIAPVARHCLAALRQKTTRDVLLCLDGVFALVAFLFLRSFGLLFLSFLLAWAIVFWDMWMSTFSVVVKRLNAHTFSPQDAPVALDPRMTKRIDDLAANQHGNVTIYSGFLPFIGAGFEVGGWSFVVDLCKPRPGLAPDSKPTPVEPGEMYVAIRNAVQALGISNLTVEDRLYVQGTDIRGDLALLPNPASRPASSVDPAVLQGMIGTSSHRVRHYQCIRVIDWRGELVVSLFLRFPIQSGRMFCEYNNFLLTPVKEELHRADGLAARIELRQVTSILRRSGLATIGLWPRSPRVIFKPLTRSREASRQRREVERNPLFDHGARPTALDRVRSANYRRFFQRVDKEMYVKMLERIVLDKIIDVLSAHGINTSIIDESRATIINNGVMSGGSVTAENLAVGSNAGIFNKVRGAMGASRGSGTPNPGSGTERPGPTAAG
jgi:hypothetical protein